jgi:hypothetical protein
MAIEDNVRNQATIQGWINRWYPLAARAVNAFAPLFEESVERSVTPPLRQIDEALHRYYRDHLRSMGLEVPC